MILRIILGIRIRKARSCSEKLLFSIKMQFFQLKGKNEQERKQVIKKERTEEMGPIKTERKK